MTKTWLVVGVAMLAATPAGGQSFLAWKGLEAGPYRVGFRSEIVSDRSRSIQPPEDILGRPHTDYGARPIQVDIWYPADGRTSGSPMTYGHYLALLGWPVGAGAADAKARADADLDYIQTVTPGARAKDATLLERLALSVVRARRDARAAAGRHPTLVYAPGSGYPAFDNSVLFEFLASHGYVVIASPSVGPDARRFADDRPSVEAQARDVEFLIGHAQGLSFVDPDRIACAGFSGGGIPATLAAIRHRRVRALVSLDGTIAFGAFLAMMRAHPDFDPLRIRVPTLVIARPSVPGSQRFGDRTFVDGIVHADRVDATVTGIEHHDMASMSSLLRRAARPDAAPDWTAATAGYEEIARLIRRFLDGALPKNAAERRPMELPSTAHITLTFTRGRPAPATPADFHEVLRVDGLARAVSLLRETRRTHPDAVAAFETPLLRTGYEYLAQGRAGDAVALFELCTEILPDSLNAWDSLGEGALALGDLDRAERCYRDVLRRVEADQTMSAARRATFSESAKKGLDEVARRREKRAAAPIR